MPTDFTELLEQHLARLQSLNCSPTTIRSRSYSVKEFLRWLDSGYAVRSPAGLTTEPIDIYVNPTFLPDEINGQYDDLWTEDRIDQVVAALVECGVALEINNGRQIPSPVFLHKAKAAGVKFTFGTNNVTAESLGRMDYAIEMIGELGLTPGDMWLPEE